MRTSKDKVITFVKRKIKDRQSRLDKKDNFGLNAFCPASRWAYEQEIVHYKYILRKLR